MANTTTTFFAAYNYFLATLRTSLTGLADPWTVFDGDPRQGEYNYVAALLATGSWVTTPAGIGAGSPSFPLDEEYSIDARLACWDQTIDQSLTRASRASAFEAIMAGIRADPTLGGIALWSYLSAVVFEQGPTDASGSFTQLDVSLTVRARIH